MATLQEQIDELESVIAPCRSRSSLDETLRTALASGILAEPHKWSGPHSISAVLAAPAGPVPVRVFVSPVVDL